MTNPQPETLPPTKEPLQPEQPDLRLDFYPGYIIRTVFDGLAICQTALDPHDVAVALSDAAIASPILATSCGEVLFWSRQDGHDQIGLYHRPARWRVQLAGSQPLTIPLPGLLFVGHYAQYWLFACKERPTTPTSRLYLPPCPNLFDSGQVCRGNVPFPACTMATISDAFQLFLTGSEFNNHLSRRRCRSYPENCLTLWQKLAGKRRFPLSELLPAGSLTLQQVREQCRQR